MLSSVINIMTNSISKWTCEEALIKCPSIIYEFAKGAGFYLGENIIRSAACTLGDDTCSTIEPTTSLRLRATETDMCLSSLEECTAEDIWNNPPVEAIIWTAGCIITMKVTHDIASAAYRSMAPK